MRRLAFAVAAATGVAEAGCAVRRAPSVYSAAMPCRYEQAAGELHWNLREDPDERSALDAWCRGVGPPVFVSDANDSDVAVLDTLTVIVWNQRVGDGNLRGLLSDLRSGRLTGGRVEHFVVLLQEAMRGGPAVPAQLPEWAASAAHAGGAEREDIGQLAAEQGLALFYAPSMRNGADSAEDKGNAILSTLALRAPSLVELPWERQRRVAVTATIEGSTSAGGAWSLRLVSAHLDNRTRFGRIFRSFGAGRTHQARVLAEHLASAQPTVFGADLNTWTGGHDSGAARALREIFPAPSALPAEATLPLPGPLPDLRLDYMLFQLPEGWDAGYRVLADTYGSDHRPLLGHVVVAPLGATNQSSSFSQRANLSRYALGSG